MVQKAIASPDEIERFARELTKGNEELRNLTTRLQRGFGRLGDTWRDQEHRKFAQEFEQTMRVLNQFMRSVDKQVPFLQRKARRLREYLNEK